MYFTSAPITWSAPVRQHVDWAIEEKTWFTEFAATGGLWYRLIGESFNTYYRVLQVFLPIPGNYKLSFQIAKAALSGGPSFNIKIVLNDQTVAQYSYPGNVSVEKQITVALNKIPGNSILEFWSTPGKAGIYEYYYLFRNIALVSSRPIYYEILDKTSNVQQTERSASPTPQLDEGLIGAPLPPPVRDVSNLPTKRKGGILV